jgi:putative oxidoreductase
MNSASTDAPSTTGATGRSSTIIRVQDSLQKHFLQKHSGAALSAVRVVVSFLFVCHGALTLFGVFGGVDSHGATAPVGSWPYWWAGVIQLIGGGLVLFGLFTRPAALLCSGAMAFAYFSVHQRLGPLPLQNHGELATLYSWIFLLIAILGPGPYALDAILPRPRPQTS